jgi:cytochrome b involved in lipid metabolism
MQASSWASWWPTLGWLWPSGKQEKAYTFDEVKKLATEGSYYIVIAGKVYDVTKYLMEHPGGHEILQASVGIDATGSFENLRHSEDARKQLQKLLIGKLVKDRLSAS